jgi:hypothetical protein
MTELVRTRSLLIDGYSGLPHQIEPNGNSRWGTIEWLRDAVERHALGERDALQHYERLRTATGDPVIALVMRLILEDEERHHGLLWRVEASLRDALDWTHSPNALPETHIPQPPIAGDLVEIARALIVEERGGARHLRDLARSEERVGSELHVLLLELMAMDSDKHARLLEFVHHRLVARARAADGPGD